MKHIGLFEGIGGFSLAARWMGWETIAWCEWIEFNKNILRKHFPNAQEHGDITQTDFSIYRGQCDIITGGFPCQPFSAAGKRLGNEDDRHLWPEMLRAIREIQPSWIVGENVLGLLNWNGGLVFHEVQTNLEAEGFVMFPYVLPACSVGADHRRDRVWFVAYSFKNRAARESANSDRPRSITETINNVQGGFTTNPDQVRLSNQEEIREMGWWRPGLHHERNKFDISEIEPGICRGNDGVSKKLDEGRLMALGNAIVPQVALQIFKAIEQYQLNHNG